MASLSLKHVVKEYYTGLKAVDDFNLEIEDGEFVVLVGPSGCGKSTVLRMIAGLEEITDGEIYIGDRLVNDVEPQDRDIAMVFQNYALFPHYTVARNIGFSLRINKVPREKGFRYPKVKNPLVNAYRSAKAFLFQKAKRRHLTPEEINSRVREVAEILDLTPYLDRLPKNLSGGQRQRVALGRAIIRHPAVFLLDEPLSNLDAKMRATMRTEITKLHQRLSATFIYVTHDQVEAMTMGTKIVVLKDGVVQQIASPTQLFNHPANKFVGGFIGTPQMNFFSGTLSDSKILTDGPTFELGESIKRRLTAPADKTVTLGIRPRSIFADGHQNYQVSHSFKAMITLVEQLGDELLVYFHLDNFDSDFVAIGNPVGNYHTGDIIDFSYDPNSLHIFDAEGKTCLDMFN